MLEIFSITQSFDSKSLDSCSQLFPDCGSRDHKRSCCGAEFQKSPRSSFAVFRNLFDFKKSTINAVQFFILSALPFF